MSVQEKRRQQAARREGDTRRQQSARRQSDLTRHAPAQDEIAERVRALTRKGQAIAGLGIGGLVGAIGSVVAGILSHSLVTAELTYLPALFVALIVLWWSRSSSWDGALEEHAEVPTGLLRLGRRCGKWSLLFAVPYLAVLFVQLVSLFNSIIV